MHTIVSRRAPLRLRPDVYADVNAVCSVTVAVKGRVPVFADPAVAQAVADTLRDHARHTGVIVAAHCVMPDHVHLVVSPSERCDVITFVGQFKNLAQRAAWRLGVAGAFWQPRFWDHFVRNNEDLDSPIRCVLENPVRAGIVDAAEDYAFSGVGGGVVAQKAGGKPPPYGSST